MKKEINFKREIIYWKILPLFPIFPIIKFLIITFAVLLQLKKAHQLFLEVPFEKLPLEVEMEVTFLVVSILVLAIICITYLILQIVNFIFPKEKMKEIIEETLNEISGKTGFSENQEILEFFEKKGFFKKETKEIYKKIFEKHYSKDFETFKNWIKTGNITPRKLYIKMLSNKQVQKEIQEEYMKKILKSNVKKILKEVIAEDKEEKEIKEKEKNKREIENYFSEKD